VLALPQDWVLVGRAALAPPQDWALVEGAA